MEKNDSKPTGLFQSVASKLSRFFKRENPAPEPKTDVAPETAKSAEPRTIDKVPTTPLSTESQVSQPKAPEPIAVQPAVADADKSQPNVPEPKSEGRQAAAVALKGVQSAVPTASTRPTTPAASTAETPSNFNLSALSSKRRLHISDLSSDEAKSLLSTYVSEHISDEQLNVETMASQLKVTRTGLYQLVHEIFGVTPANYIMDCRMRYACELLMMGKKVREVSSKCGFADPKYFSKVFKKYFKVLPSAYCDAQ